MGNRAVITSKDKKSGLYLHWNGGRDSVNAFLTYCKLQGYRGFGEDNTYALARLTQVVCNWFGGSLSVGVGAIGDYYKEEVKDEVYGDYVREGYKGELDCNNYDNGLYIVDGWDIVGREFFEGKEQNTYDLKYFIYDINLKQPESMQLTNEEIENYFKED